MSIQFTDGQWAYQASTAAGTVQVAYNQKVLVVHAYASPGDGSFWIGSSSSPVVVRSGLALDWTPGGRVTNTNLTFTSNLDWFVEVATEL